MTWRTERIAICPPKRGGVAVVLLLARYVDVLSVSREFAQMFSGDTVICYFFRSLCLASPPLSYKDSAIL